MMLSEMLLYLTEAPLDAAPPCGMARVAAYLTSHAYEEISLDRLSEEVGISKFHLCRAFRRDSGLTPHAYLGYLRVLRAQELLMQGLPAQEVGEAVGFRDYSTFFRTYKKMLGRAPTSPEGEEADK
jgi:AraC-like DNA-binding protein